MEKIKVKIENSVRRINYIVGIKKWHEDEMTLSIDQEV